jgi:hypothetical protein
MQPDFRSSNKLRRAGRVKRRNCGVQQAHETSAHAKPTTAKSCGLLMAGMYVEVQGRRCKVECISTGSFRRTVSP